MNDRETRVPLRLKVEKSPRREVQKMKQMRMTKMITVILFHYLFKTSTKGQEHQFQQKHLECGIRKAPINLR